MDLYTIFQGGYTDNKWRLLGEYLKGREITAGEGIRIDDSSSSGTLISAPPKREKKQSQPPPFSIISLRKDDESGDYKVELQEGWVTTKRTNVEADAVEFTPVEINGELMSTRPRPELTISENDFVFLDFDTDEEGFVIGTPEIRTGDEEESDHHQPPSGEGDGAGGSYKVKLFQFTLDEGAPQITFYQQSDYEHFRLWSGNNIGAGRYIHKEWNGVTDRYDFRTLEQFVPTGQGHIPEYGKVIVDPVGEEFDATNDSIKFSCLSEKFEDPQIEVNDDGEGTITIEGNNKFGTLVWRKCDEEEDDVELLSWSDGLITNTNPVPVITAGCEGLPEGYAGDILYHDGTDWVTLARPANANVDGEGYLLSITAGNFPEWVPYDIALE